MATFPRPTMYDYSSKGLQALRRLHRAQAFRRLLPHWHLRRQLQRLKHSRWRGQNSRSRGQKLQLPQGRMLCPSRPSFRQQLQGQRHPLGHLPCPPPAHLPARLPSCLPRSRSQLQRLPQASFWTSPWLRHRHHLFPSSRERCPKLFPPQSGPRCHHCQALRLVRQWRRHQCLRRP